MLEKILAFITPGPLNEIFGFRLRVFTSWITLGLALGLVSSIIGLSSGAATTGNAATLIMFNLQRALFGFCFLGLVGLGIDAVGERRSEYPGWYWLLFPIVTYIFLGITLFVTIFALAFRISLPTPRIPQQGRRRNPDDRAIKNWLKNNSNQSGEKFVRENPKFKPQNRLENAVYQEIVQNSNKTIKEIISNMSEEEYEAFIEMLMRRLGFTFLS
ncbi:MAG: hypothetical protein WBG73_13150 [Coleofasciculaceae cyanobacterium]